MKNKINVNLKTEGIYTLMIHDSDGEIPFVGMFPDIESAKNELKAMYLEDLRVEKEENGRADEDMTSDFDDENGLWAVIRVRLDVADDMFSVYYTITQVSKPKYKVTVNHHVCGSTASIENCDDGVWVDTFDVPESEDEENEGCYCQVKTFYSDDAALGFCGYDNRIGPVSEVHGA
ncbi:MAG: hypothetical protein IKS98_08105 [Lachnospiraceae bacterium]|nr:hypothetical protein [Lachnospiraceae bacterium]